MRTLLMHADSHVALMEALERVPVPPGTDTWSPVPYAKVVTYVEEKATKRLGAPPLTRQFGFSQKKQQLFAVFGFEGGNTEALLSVGVRQSYNKSMALGLVTGANVTVCDNLCFDGSSIRVVRKNTPRVWEDFIALVEQALDQVRQDFQNVIDDSGILKAVPCGEKRGAEIIGLAQYKGVLALQQAAVAMRTWSVARHEAFSLRNLWSLYNCFTEATKNTPVGTVMERYANVHAFFRSIVDGLDLPVLERVMARKEVGQVADADKGDE